MPLYVQIVVRSPSSGLVPLLYVFGLFWFETGSFTLYPMLNLNSGSPASASHVLRLQACATALSMLCPKSLSEWAKGNTLQNAFRIGPASACVKD